MELCWYVCRFCFKTMPVYTNVYHTYHRKLSFMTFKKDVIKSKQYSTIIRVRIYLIGNRSAAEAKKDSFKA